MSKIVIFAGTSEGREISEELCTQKIPHIVCVATQYGRDVMKQSEYAEVHTGRMDRDEIKQFLRESASLVIDATHPYASVVSENIEESAKEIGIEYIRVKRDSIDCAEEEGIRYIDRECNLTEVMRGIEGNILLTTGTKLLSGIELNDEEKSKLYVRIIPSEESIRTCLNAGIPVKNIIAMQGPFSAAMNEAIIREYDIRCLITKESGAAGGFAEKIEAATAVKIPVIVIGRPCSEQGLNVNEVIGRICPAGRKIDISLVGMGMGSKNCMTGEAVQAIGDAQIVFGPKRMLEGIKHKKAMCCYRASDIIPVIKENGYIRVAVLFSGDSGFYSGANTFLQDVKSLCDNFELSYDIKLIPGLSSVAYLASRVGRSYSEAFIYSIHGKKGNPINMNLLREGIVTHEDSFVLLSGDEDVRLIGEMLSEQSSNYEISNYEIILGDRLSYEDEKIIRLSVEEARAYLVPGLYTAYIHNAQPIRKVLIPYIEDGEFIRNETPMTKEIIRHEVVRLLNIREGDTVYDIGSGTGSVSIEIASLHPSINVHSIEINPTACECMRENIKKFGCSNIELIEGEASNVIPSLPTPNAVFIGGSKGKLRDIIEAIPRSENGIRVVITAITLETVEQLLDIKKEDEVINYRMHQLQVTDLKEMGSHNLMGAQNPVFICSFDIMP